MSKKIGIDLGTANTLVFLPKKGVVINEPTVVAVSLDDNRILAVGAEAKEMIGKTPETIIASRPMKNGAIADYRTTEAMIRYFINKSSGRIRVFKPEVMISIPAGITSTERRAVIDAAIQAGAKTAYVIKEPILAAIGAGIPINTPSGGIVAFSSARIGGDKIDQAISEYIRKKHNLAIGERTAEKIKIKIGNALPSESEENEKTIEIRGRDLIAGLPKIIKISSTEVIEAIQEELREIVQVIKSVLQKTPPELAADIIDKGMVMSGGGALLKNLNKLITKMTGVACHVADEPLLCVVKGTGIALDNLEIYKKSIMSKK